MYWLYKMKPKIHNVQHKWPLGWYYISNLTNNSSRDPELWRSLFSFLHPHLCLFSWLGNRVVVEDGWDTLRDLDLNGMSYLILNWLYFTGNIREYLFKDILQLGSFRVLGPVKRSWLRQEFSRLLVSDRWLSWR